MPIPLPTLSENKKGNKRAVRSISNRFSGIGDAMVSSSRRKPQRKRRPTQARKEYDEAPDLSSIVSQRDSDFAKNYVKKAFDTYVNICLYIKNSVKELIDAVKTLLGLEKIERKGSTSAESVKNTPTPSISPSVEDTKEKEIQDQEQTDREKEQLTAINKIEKTLEKIHELIKKGGLGGGGGGGGWGSTLTGMAMGALGKRALIKMGSRAAAGTVGRVANIARAGRLTTVASARGASRPVMAVARASDKVVKTAAAAKQGVKALAGRAVNSATNAVGLGRSLGSRAAETVGEEALHLGRGGQIFAEVGPGAASQAAETAIEGTASAAKVGTAAAETAASTTAGAASAGKAAAETAASAAPAASGASKGAFSWLKKGWGAVKGLAKSGLEFGAASLSALKNPIAFLSKNGMKILKGMKSSAILAAVIEPIIAAYTISQIKSNPELSEEEKKEEIGKALAGSLGSAVGSILVGGVGTGLGPIGSLLGGIVGSFGGQWVGEKIAELIGPKKIYEFATSIPLIGDKIKLDSDTGTPEEPETGETPEAVEGETPPSQPSDSPDAGSPNIKGAVTAPTPTIQSTGSSASITPSAPSTTGESLQAQTTKAVNNNIEQAETSKTGTTIINNYYNNQKTAIGSSGKQPIISEGNAIPPDDTGMYSMLTKDVGRSAALGIQG